MDEAPFWTEDAAPPMALVADDAAPPTAPVADEAAY